MMNTFTMGGRLRGAVAAVAVMVLPLVGGLAACGTEDSLLEATDPDIIDPAALNTFEGAQALYFGALGRLRQATGGSNGEGSSWLFGGLLADVIHPFPAFNRVLGQVLEELAAKVARQGDQYEQYAAH